MCICKKYMLGDKCKIMKKNFHKISKYVFYAGMLALLGLLWAVSGLASDTIADIMMVIALSCILVLAVFCVFTFLNFIVACVEDWKKDKKEIARKCIAMCIGMAVAYVLLCLISEEQRFSMIKMIVYSTITTIGIIGGGYMMEKHPDDEE